MSLVPKRDCIALFILSCLLPTLGCGQGPPRPDNLPPLTECTVEIFLDGVPASEATVTLVPESGEWVGVGSTNQSGKAIMLTQGRYAGVPVGEYKVTVTKYEANADASPDASSADEDSKLFQQGVREKTRNSLVPERYTKVETSDLRITVSEQPISTTFKLKK